MGISKLNPSAGGIPFGNTAGRPTAATGKLYSNGETARLELYTSAGAWENIVQEVPGVSGISGAYSESANSGTITINGTNFVSGAIASATGTNSVEVQASSTTYNSLVQLTAVFTGLSNANEPYDIKVTNPSNLFGSLPDALYINASPVWSTSAGSLGTFTEQVSISVSATATDSDSTITYSLASGSTLPSGITLNSSTGLISGTLPDIDSDTTYTFTVNASDGVNTAVARSFSITSKAIFSVDYLVVAGGGGGGGMSAAGGGNGSSAGGGAGGLRSTVTATGRGASLETPLSVLTGTNYLVTVGNGGAGGPRNSTEKGSNGLNSVFSTITALGGGGGGSYQNVNGANGGSGGGGGYFNGNGGSGTSAQGYDGGSTSTGSGGAGGGGGAGGNGETVTGAGGNGGIGVAVAITGSSVYYAGGGGGGQYNTGQIGAGGNGGGGQGGADRADGNAGSANRGGGGGGAGGTGTSTGTTQSAGGAGGSGVVILRYPDTKIITIGAGLTGTESAASGGYKRATITSGSGNVSWA